MNKKSLLNRILNKLGIYRYSHSDIKIIRSRSEDYLYYSYKSLTDSKSIRITSVSHHWESYGHEYVMTISYHVYI